MKSTKGAKEMKIKLNQKVKLSISRKEAVMLMEILNNITDEDIRAFKELGTHHENFAQELYEKLKEV